jgi:L-alanine-DL-glutamate epimerase-like enolase superfamily enzyme
MHNSFSRRTFLALPVGLAAIDTLRAAVKPVRIADIDLFTVDVPVTRAENAAGVQHSHAVVKLVTDAGVTGYSFAGPYPGPPRPVIKQALVGKDLFNVVGLLREGLWRWGGVEHAVWDAIGKIAGQPVFKLLGGREDRVNAYLTCVWPGPADQQQVPFNEATGPDFHLMFDRTAEAPVVESGQLVWDFETGLKVARALQKEGAYWLEEPFARPDYETPAKLASMVDILITGGEGYDSIDSYRQCLLHRTYDILQPDGNHAGGIFRCRQVGILGESFHVPVILHGTMSLMLAGWLQATLAMGAPWQEMALITPPLLPEEQWAPGLKLLRSKQMFTIENGQLVAQPYPGIGLDVDEDALNRYRIRT